MGLWKKTTATHISFNRFIAVVYGWGGVGLCYIAVITNGAGCGPFRERHPNNTCRYRWYPQMLRDIGGSRFRGLHYWNAVVIPRGPTSPLAEAVRTMKSIGTTYSLIALTFERIREGCRSLCCHAAVYTSRVTLKKKIKRYRATITSTESEKPGTRLFSDSEECSSRVARVARAVM